jgi:hypothetical protein
MLHRKFLPASRLSVHVVGIVTKLINVKFLRYRNGVVLKSYEFNDLKALVGFAD